MDSSYFYNYLSPYGYWTSHLKHGYVWIPYSTGYGWRPYSQGRWMWTDFGWTWISDFEWGWAVGMITPAGTGSRVHNGGRPGLPGEEEVLI